VGGGKRVDGAVEVDAEGEVRDGGREGDDGLVEVVVEGEVGDLLHAGDGGVEELYILDLLGAIPVETKVERGRKLESTVLRYFSIIKEIPS
jgi:hypothetical protein